MKKHYLISNQEEAENMLLLLMDSQTILRLERYKFATKAAQAERPQQYDFYVCKVKCIDNALVTVDVAIAAVAEYLPLPQNMPTL